MFADLLLAVQILIQLTKSFVDLLELYKVYFTVLLFDFKSEQLLMSF